MDTAALFARLQLRPDADDREVRRAYARELKKIDQETQPEAFQELRETYDQLLWWLKRQAAEKLQEEQRQREEVAAPTAPEPVAESGPAIAQEPAPPPEPAPGAAMPEHAANPEALGREVIDALIQQLEAQTWAGRDQAEDALLRLLDDARLINVDARRYFEWGVAQILASGWRPGHDLLFAPATEVFGWNDDRSRLLWFGRSGEIVDAAIEEMALFDTQEWPARERQKEVIRRTRNPLRPTVKQLMSYLPVAEKVFPHFPHWLHVIAKPEAVEQWRVWDKEAPHWRRALASMTSRKVKPPEDAGTRRAKKAGLSFTVVFFVLMGLGVLNSIFKTDRAPANTSYQTFNPPALDGRIPGPASSRLIPEKQPISTEPLPRGIKQDADPKQARIDAAFIAKKKPTAEMCMDASDLARMNPEAHRRGDLGPKFDAFVMDCLVKKLAVMHTTAFEPSFKREQARLQTEINVMASRPVQSSRYLDTARVAPEEFRPPAPLEAPNYKFVPDKPSTLAPDVPRFVTDPTGQGLRYEIKEGDGRMTSRP